MDHIAPIDWVICVSYVAAIVGVGLFVSRKQQTNDDYFFAGRKMHWLPVGLSLFAASLSSNSFVGMPAEGAFGNYHQLLAILFVPFVIVPIMCLWFVPFYRSFGFISLYEYLERRFSRPIRLVASAIFVVYLAGWIGTMLLAVTRILSVVLETDATSHVIAIIVVVGLLSTLYTAIGGAKAVIWTDAIQAFVLFGGMIVLLFLVIGKIDGAWTTFFQVGAGAGKFEMFRTDGLLAERNLFSACAFGFFVYLGAHVASYGTYQRFVSVPSVKDVRQSMYIKGVFTLVSCTLYFLVGTALFVFYQQSQVEVFNELSSGKAKDQLMPHFVVHHAGLVGLTGAILAGLFAASMSSMDTGINSMTASIVTDWFEGRELGMRFNRVLTFGLGILATGVACLLSMIDTPVFDLLLSLIGATLGLLTAVFLLGMLVPRANTAGAIAAVVVGLAVFAVIRLWIPSLEGEELQRVGVFAGLKNNSWWDAMFTTVPAFSAGVLASYLRPAPPEERTRGLLLFRRRDWLNP